MFSRMKHLVRTIALSIGLLALSGGPVWAGPSDCEETAVGGQTGQSYTLQSQSLVTETRTVQLSAGGECLVGGQTSATITEQYHVGYYRNDETGKIAKVDCRTGRIIGWV